MVEIGTRTSREVSVGAVESAAVEKGTVTSREVGMEAAESAAAVEAEGKEIREGVIDADGETFTTGTVKSAESTSTIGPTTSERVSLNGAGCFSVEVLPSKGLWC